MQNLLKNTIHIALDMLMPRFCAGCGKEKAVFCPQCQDESYKTGAQCIFCGFRNAGGGFCATCRPKGTHALKSIIWAGRYEGALREAIWQFKYKKRKELARPLAEMLWKKFCEANSQAEKFSSRLTLPRRLGGLRRVSENFSACSFNVWGRQIAASFAIIPIPLHFKKEYERGFNQAELLAQEFSKLSNLALLTNSLLKVKETPAQVEVKNKELRIKNLENAFEINPKFPISNLKLLTSNTLILIDDVSTTGATLIHAADALAKAGAKKIMGLVVAHGG